MNQGISCADFTFPLLPPLELNKLLGVEGIDLGMENEQVHPLLPFASHLHFRGASKGQLQSTMGENRIDFSAIIGRSQKVNYQGWICRDYVWVDWEGCNRTDNVSELVLLKEMILALAGGLEQTPPVNHGIVPLLEENYEN